MSGASVTLGTAEFLVNFRSVRLAPIRWGVPAMNPVETAQGEASAITLMAYATVSRGFSDHVVKKCPSQCKQYTVGHGNELQNSLVLLDELRVIGS